jgi:hypothetical protein
MKTRAKLGAAVAAAALTAGIATQAQAIPVALELALLVDVSASVNAAEYAIQKTGYINAFNNALIQSNIANLAGGIAVTYIEWASGNQQASLVDWMHISDATSSGAFASAIAGTDRAFTGSTTPSAAISYATPLFGTNGFEGDRWVIDVSGDGAGGTNATRRARDAFLAAGADTGVSASINGLCIGGDSLCNWYRTNIEGGPDGFVVQASGFDDFGDAVQLKLEREIGGGEIPAPATMALLGIGMLVVGALRRRKAH